MLMRKCFPFTESYFWLSPVSLREQCQCRDTHHKCFLDTTETNSLAAGNLSSCHKKKSSNIPGIKDDYNSSNLPNEKWHIRTLYTFLRSSPKCRETNSLDKTKHPAGRRTMSGAYVSAWTTPLPFHCQRIYRIYRTLGKCLGSISLKFSEVLGGS